MIQHLETDPVMEDYRSYLKTKKLKQRKDFIIFFLQFSHTKRCQSVLDLISFSH